MFPPLNLFEIVTFSKRIEQYSYSVGFDLFSNKFLNIINIK